MKRLLYSVLQALLVGIALTVSFTASAQADERPNIVWIVSEDNGARWLGSYGNPAKPTPTLDQLAAEGFRYTNCYASVGVCAPQRFTWITGINAISAGTMNMRSGVDLPERIRFYPEIFSDLGYYTSKGKDAKADYNFRGRNANDTWSDSKNINWESLKANQPFIHVFNTHATHESRSFGAYNPNQHTAPEALNLAAYHPDLPEMRFVYEKYNECMRKLDGEVAGWLAELEASGMADNTIVIYSSDHGGVLARSKRFLYNSGTHCPLIVRIPEQYKALYPAAKPGMTVDEVVSFVDFPKTWLSLAGADAVAVEQMQGRVFLGQGKEPEPDYVFSFRQRMDDRYDMARSVRSRDLLYIRNYMPFISNGQHIPYTHNAAAMRAWRTHYLEGKTDAVTGRFFGRERAIDELYRTHEDYDNIDNLASDPAEAQTIESMRAALRAWQLEIFDSGFIPEDDMNRLASAQELTVYDYVRDPKLYPLKEYIELADLSLEMNASNLNRFVAGLGDADLGMRYWSTLGILKLTLVGDAANSPAVKSALLNKLADDQESQVIRSYSACILIRIGEREAGFAFLEQQITKTYTSRTVLNILDWMEQPEAIALIVKNYLSASQKSSDQTKVMVAKLIEEAPTELASLIQQREKLRNFAKAREGRLKKLKKEAGKMSAEKLAAEKTKAQTELDDAKAKMQQLDPQIQECL
jgi:N-sulfoglucosamine sulfohydrolase